MRVIFGLSSGATVTLIHVVTNKYTAPSELVNVFDLQKFLLEVYYRIFSSINIFIHLQFKNKFCNVGL